MDEKKIPVLFSRKEECCGCTACYAICPQKAISMLEDEEGFEYPHVNEEKCIKCYLCMKVCSFKAK
ncbi:MAG: 4Fe-4S dicluster domain-containing protein [Ruminococcus sp.]|nr:4Fe-4S dicluster domain-containing protein [Ruminococcus sp.]